jgi:hypothetical protein
LSFDIKKKALVVNEGTIPNFQTGATLETGTIPNFLKGARFWRPEPDVVFTHFCITRKQNIPFLFCHWGKKNIFILFFYFN